MKTAPTDTAVDAFVENRERLIAIACTMVESRAVAEELVQDSWLRWQGQTYHASGARQVLHKIVRNLAIDWCRRNSRERDIMKAHFAAEETAPDSERVISAREELRRVVRALKSLPPRTVQAFRMHRVDGQSYARIGKALNVSGSTAFGLVEDAMVEIALHLSE
ncbi:MAG: sigma-70 family RNA polymerase sigma factor [Pseudomonadota bacterium]